jgi:hypothetical protein
MEGSPQIVVVEKPGDERDVAGNDLPQGIYLVTEIKDDPFAYPGTYNFEGPPSADGQPHNYWVNTSDEVSTD